MGCNCARPGPTAAATFRTGSIRRWSFGMQVIAVTRSGERIWLVQPDAATSNRTRFNAENLQSIVILIDNQRVAIDAAAQLFATGCTISTPWRRAEPRTSIWNTLTRSSMWTGGKRDRWRWAAAASIISFLARHASDGKGDERRALGNPRRGQLRIRSYEPPWRPTRDTSQFMQVLSIEPERSEGRQDARLVRQPDHLEQPLAEGIGARPARHVLRSPAFQSSATTSPAAWRAGQLELPRRLHVPCRLRGRHDLKVLRDRYFADRRREQLLVHGRH